MKLRQLAGYALIAGGALYLLRSQPAVARVLSSLPGIGGGGDPFAGFTFEPSSVIGAAPAVSAPVPAPVAAPAPAPAPSPYTDAWGNSLTLQGVD